MEYYIISSKMSNYQKKKGSTKCSLASRQQMKQLFNLTEELHRSRIAVQHISSNAQSQLKSSQMVSEIKRQLKQCILLIKSQQRKQTVLKELVGLLKGQMSKIQLKEQQVNQREQLEFQKSIKQMRDDIDKIFHKKNHEVAKIAELKEKASQSRSQRVVFSNLFKKIEKQLKQHQQIYKKQILKAENNKINFSTASSQKLRQKINQLSKSSVPEDLCHNNSTKLHNESLLINPKNHKYHMETSAFPEPELEDKSYVKQDCLNINLNTLESKEERHKNCGKEGYLQKSAEPQRCRTKSTRVGRMNSSKENIINYQIVIDELIKFVDRMRAAVGVGSYQEIIQLMENLPDENEKFEADIEELNEKIEYYNQKNAEILAEGYREKMNDSDFDQFEQKLAIKSTLCGFKHLQEAKEKKFHKYNYFKASKQLNDEKSISNIQQQLSSISSILGIELSSSQHFNNELNLLKDFSSLQFAEKCEEIDTIIDKILQADDPTLHHKSSEAQSILIKNNTSLIQRQQRIQDFSNEMVCMQGLHKKQQKFQRRESGGQLNLIINKMSKFGNSEKLFDRNGFYQEYHNQLKCYREGAKKAKSKNKRD